MYDLSDNRAAPANLGLRSIVALCFLTLLLAPLPVGCDSPSPPVPVEPLPVIPDELVKDVSPQGQPSNPNSIAKTESDPDTPSTLDSTDSPQAAIEKHAVDSDPAPDEQSVESLFDGKTMEGWESIAFGGDESTVENGAIVVPAGYSMNGISSTRENLPKTNYEILLSARKMSGQDFFCGLTFPVADSHCTLIVGGWGGGLVGLSSIDDEDASNNDTRTYGKFENDQWYKIKIRVVPHRIQAWIDDEQVVDKDLTGHKISLRNEVLESRPLGITNFETTTEIKDIQLIRFPGQ